MAIELYIPTAAPLIQRIHIDQLASSGTTRRTITRFAAMAVARPRVAVFNMEIVAWLNNKICKHWGYIFLYYNICNVIYVI